MISSAPCLFVGADAGEMPGIERTQMNYIETECVVEHNGQRFESGGAIVTPDYLIAYPAENGRLNDWHGNQIGSYRITSTRPAIFFGRRSWMGDKFHTMRATVNGRNYNLRGFGVGMVAKGKALKH